MAATQSLPDAEPRKFSHLPFLSKLRHKKKDNDGASERRISLVKRSPTISPPPPTQIPSNSLLHDLVTDSDIESEFVSLQQAITDHVHKFYSKTKAETSVSRSAVEHATAGLSVPWLTFLSLLGEKQTRFGTLIMCIGWTILSRSLLLRLGLSNSPGSTFLPPEIVECFQSFSLGLSAAMGGNEEHGQGMLSSRSSSVLVRE